MLILHIGISKHLHMTLPWRNILHFLISTLLIFHTVHQPTTVILWGLELASVLVHDNPEAVEEAEAAAAFSLLSYHKPLFAYHMDMHRCIQSNLMLENCLITLTTRFDHERYPIASNLDEFIHSIFGSRLGRAGKHLDYRVCFYTANSL